MKVSSFLMFFFLSFGRNFGLLGNRIQSGSASKTLQKDCKSVFSTWDIDEWGTSGRCRPTILDLWELCAELDMKRACDYIAQDILGRSAQELSHEGIFHS
jgi:hypothetical protein